MAQYCPLCGDMTNCTEDCDKCLKEVENEEEFKMKKFTMVVTQNEAYKFNFETKNEGFSAFEIIGFLESKKNDIVRQVTNHSEFKRTWVQGDKECNITEEEM